MRGRVRAIERTVFLTAHEIRRRGYGEELGTQVALMFAAINATLQGVPHEDDRVAFREYGVNLELRDEERELEAGQEVE
jgi:hypothetical protein